jgi:hypothetical protein
MPECLTKPRDSNRGSVLIQWCIAALPLLLLGSLAIEITHWHLTRMRLSLSVQQAVDHASLTGGTTEGIKAHLTKQLPRDLRLQLHGCLTEAVEPLMADFIDHRLSQKQGKALIRHDHVAQQHNDYRARGWPDGRGPRSGKTIFEANTLAVEVVASMQTRNPWLRQIYDPLTIRLTHRAVMQSHRQQTPLCFTLN